MMQVIKMRWAKHADDGLFVISEGDDGTLYASRDESPFFMVSGETEDDVRQQAHAAIASYFTLARSRTITKEQVEEAARAMAAEIDDRDFDDPTDEEWNKAALAAAKAFGLTIADE